MDFDRVKMRRPKSLLFLCGGLNLEAAVVTSSVREALLRHLPNRSALMGSSIVLAERAVEALPSTNFENLLDLEECVAALVDAVVLIVESAGSICELGAFAKTDEIRRKLIVILPNHHNNHRSFITLGALKYIEDNSKSPEIHPFDWTDVTGGVAVPPYALNGMVNEIDGVIGRLEAKPRFDPTMMGHRIYLTLAFCHLLRGAKLAEIKECFLAVKHIPTLTEKEIRKYLDTLQICGLIDRVANGAKNVHYIPLVERLPIEPAFSHGVRNDQRNILRWVNTIAQDIRDQDPVRMDMFQEHNHAA